MFLFATCGLNLASKKFPGPAVRFLHSQSLTAYILVIGYGLGRHAAVLPTENIVKIAKVRGQNDSVAIKFTSNHFFANMRTVAHGV